MEDDAIPIGERKTNYKAGEFPATGEDGIRHTREIEAKWEKNTLSIVEKDSVVPPKDLKKLFNRVAYSKLSLDSGVLTFDYDYAQTKPGVEDWPDKERLNLHCELKPKAARKDERPHKAVEEDETLPAH